MYRSQSRSHPSNVTDCSFIVWKCWLSLWFLWFYLSSRNTWIVSTRSQDSSGLWNRLCTSRGEIFYIMDIIGRFGAGSFQNGLLINFANLRNIFLKVPFFSNSIWTSISIFGDLATHMQNSNRSLVICTGYYMYT